MVSFAQFEGEVKSYGPRTMSLVIDLWIGNEWPNRAEINEKDMEMGKANERKCFHLSLGGWTRYQRTRTRGQVVIGGGLAWAETKLSVENTFVVLDTYNQAWGDVGRDEELGDSASLEILKKFYFIFNLE